MICILYLKSHPFKEYTLVLFWHIVYFYGQIIFHVWIMHHFIYPFISLWKSRLFPLFGYYEKCCYEHLYASFLCGYMFSFFLGRYLRVELVDHKVTIRNILSIFQTFPNYTILHFHQQCIGFRFLHILANTCCLPFL